VGGTEVARERVPLPASPGGELLHVMPAAIVRQLPEVNIEITLSTTDAGVERAIGTYTLVHAGPMHR
jgi:hypothetical protein